MTRKHSRFISIISNRLLAILHGHASIDDYVMKEKEKYKPKASETTEEALPEDIPDEIRMLMNELLEDPAALETTEEAVPSKPSFPLLCLRFPEPYGKIHIQPNEPFYQYHCHQPCIRCHLPAKDRILQNTQMDIRYTFAGQLY